MGRRYARLVLNMIITPLPTDNRHKELPGI
jgi:hypothetical protein